MTELNVQEKRVDLEPFIKPHRDKFVGLLLAYEFRRSRARAAAVMYGTTTASGIPLTSTTATELSYYYNKLVEQAKRDQRSEEIFEEYEVKRIDIETIGFRLRNEELTLDEKNELLKEMTDLAAELEKLIGEMEELGRA